MSWIAIAQPGEAGWVCPQTFGGDSGPRAQLIPKGTIMIETRLSPDARPQTLLAYERAHPWQGAISLQAIPGGGVVLILNQGGDIFHTVLEHGQPGRTDTLRVTFSWDSPARWGRLVLERPESDSIDMVVTPAPPPIMLEDIDTMARRSQLVQMDSDVVFFAVSTKIEPVGPMPALAGNTPIEVPGGYTRIDDLKSCDQVLVAHDHAVPVLHKVSRIVPALGSFQPVRLRAPYFGLMQDVIVAPDKRLVIGGSEVEYNFGQEAVLVPARHLINGYAARWEQGHRLVRYVDLMLPGHEPLCAAGTEVDSLYVGRLRRKPELLNATLLADCRPELMPEHGRSSFPVLKPFEAITLAEARAA